MAVAASSYPQRPGETECQYYMKTGTCKYAQKCKFHHPPDVTPAFHPLAPPTDVTIGLNKESYPRRPGEQSCTFFLKTGTCKYKMSCKFDHPPEAIQQTLHLQNTPYPQRPGEQHCAYYLKTGKCKFGATCRYDHPVLRPNDHAAGGLLPPPSPYHQSHLGGEPRLLPVGPPPMAGPYGYGHPADNLVTLMPPAHPMAYTAPTAQQLPQRPGEKECTFFLKTARCQYGQRCKFHHPAEKLAGNLAPLNVMGMPGMAPYPMGPAGVPLDPYGMSAYGPPMPQGPVPPMPPPRGSGMGVVPGPGSHHGGPQDMGPGAAAMLPERPGVEPCGYYLRTGMCSYGMSCRFDHPRHVPSQDNHAMMNGHGSHADSHHATSSSGGHQQQPAAADAEETKSQDMGTEDGVQKKEADQKNDGAEYGQTNGHASEQTKTAPGYGGQNGHSPAYQQYPAAAGATPTTNGSGGYGDSNGYAGTGPQGAYVAPYGASATSAAGYGGYRAQA